jgi:hypothetical protein
VDASANAPDVVYDPRAKRLEKAEGSVLKKNLTTPIPGRNNVSPASEPSIWRFRSAWTSGNRIPG